jgi:hypothetical protein
MALCEICGAESETRYDFRYPNEDNEDTSLLICKSCHESIRVLINEFIESLDEVSSTKKKNFYPVRYPNLSNLDTITYIKYEDYRALEDEINMFVENGGL